MAAGGFFPYLSLWHGNDPAECTGAFHSSGGMMCAFGLSILVLQPIQISYYLQDMFFLFFFVSGSTHVLLIFYELAPLNPPLHLSMKGQKLNDDNA
jgi:hypothetical protein